MYTPLFWLALGLAAADWAAAAFHQKRVHWFTKPATLAVLILWFSLSGRWAGPLAAVGLGLVFALLGDILLLLPPRYFSAGMTSFFLTHLFYIAGFNLPLWLVPSWEAILPILVVAGAFAGLNHHIRKGLNQGGEKKLIAPFTAYGIALSLTWLSALNTLLRPDWALLPAILVALGGSLFFLSDSILAHHRFVRRLRYGDLAVMSTYHLAQILIAAGALEHFLN